ncbi:putative HNH endonuclease [Pseudomonas phage vB_PsyM_KIL3b]|uniref:Putative HNH endonuclease n=3 Tax=Pseudomonas phage vB_PsyM_KIL1 TaxID=1777065 RepID=A0A142IDY5_9CAUD|nr:putative HNH endonuclease [Pseudomonas phage vB_PsyM_KIL2]AMR57600.1 putative HNH endonuclease [Pseudomonas phage vB_PsyM_KIL3]AMR58098.1 putative HNH endonuclease [Pseudomonas phage vB_PsyM_KIL3b]
MFTHLTVLGDSGLRNKSREVLWSCECVCGKILNLRTGTLKIGDNRLFKAYPLRWATASTQQQNKPASERNFNGYPVICLTSNRYVARIRHNGKRLYLGCFKTAEEAHAVYDAKGRELFGEEWVSYEEDKNDEDKDQMHRDHS